MLNARAIYRLLIDDEQPVPPGDPQQLDTSYDPDALDPKAEVMRYAEQPFRIPGSSPTTLHPRLRVKLGNRQTRKLERNTLVARRGESYAIQFHQTDVVTAEPDGKIIIRTGGWHPGGRHSNDGWKMAAGATTMDRINSNLDGGWKLFKKGAKMDGSQPGTWYWYNWETGAGTTRDDNDGTLYPFTEGDTIHPDGSLLVQADPIYPKRRKRRT